MTISLHPLTPQDIESLHDPKALYILDYRALGESMDYDIPAMRKYENLAPRILTNQHVLVNEHAAELNYPHPNHLHVIPTGTIAKTALLERVEQSGLLTDLNFEKIVAFIPHPTIDRFCTQHGKTLSYSYTDFLLLNDKIAQKKNVTDTPDRKIIETSEEIASISDKENRYLKRDRGSGGFTVFPLTCIQENKKFQDLFTHEALRYLEQKVVGIPMSIQAYKLQDNYTVFGIAQQEIKDGKEFRGAQILPLGMLERDNFLREKIQQCLDELGKNLLPSYQGFFGVDFIYNQLEKKFWFLEGNIRLTALTIPTLLVNNGLSQVVFREDYNGPLYWTVKMEK